MEKYKEAREKALNCIATADHLLTMTYPLVEDPKLLLSVVENIFLGLTNAMAALLYYERKYKRIPPFQDNFHSKYNMFKMRIIDRYDINKNYLDFINEIKEIVLKNKKSPFTFTRKEKFVICSKDYKLETLKIKDIKNHLQKAKLFIHKITSIIGKNEKVYSKSKRRTKKN